MSHQTHGTSAQSERQRIRLEYERRDQDPSLHRRFRLTEPAFLFHMQEREWAILKLLRRARLRLEGRRVLEVGCGDGHILQRFLEFGAAEAVGVDLMGDRIRSARRRFPTVNAVVGDGTTLPLADDSFDLVMQFMCISSVLDPAVRQTIAREMWRVLRPGGAILSYDMRTMPVITRALMKTARLLARPLLGRQSGSPESNPEPSVRTPVLPLDLKELFQLFVGDFRVTSVSLDGNLAKLAVYSRWLPLLLGACPLLRTHYLAVIRKAQP